jgi:hypothetical protein
MRRIHHLAMMAALVPLANPTVKAGPMGYAQTNLVSDLPGVAQVTGTASLYSYVGNTVGQPLMCRGT